MSSERVEYPSGDLSEVSNPVEDDRAPPRHDQLVIENPLEGPKLADNDAKMKALEAYILDQRKGVALDAGKH